MCNRTARAWLLTGACSVIVMAAAPVAARGQTPPAAQPKKVLVELYTSQGCNSCPPAADFLGKFKALGYGPDRVVALNFHVDYFNTPWEDPFSNRSFSDREQSYNQVMKRTDLYFTPMMMVDGRTPLLGSSRDKAGAAIRQARTSVPGVTLDIGLDDAAPRKTVAVKLEARSNEVAGRDLLIGVALTENRVTTKVSRGENAGKTLVEYHVVRRLDHKFLKLDRTGPKTLTFPVDLPTGSDPANFQVAAFAQDRATGVVHQADSIPWTRPQPTAITTSR